MNDHRITEEHIAAGLKSAKWPARLQRLKGGALSGLLGDGSELWLDGGHNADAGVVLAQALKSMTQKPVVIIWGMLNTKDATQFFRPLASLAAHVVTLTIPSEANAITAENLATTVHGLGVTATTASDITTAVVQAAALHPTQRILICGSLYLAGHVLAAEDKTEMSAVTGAARR